MDIEEINLICLGCPVSCKLTINCEEKNLIKVEGNQCKIGIKFATSEIEDPRRMVATTVRVKGGIHLLVPVYTTLPFPKPLVMDLMKELRKIELKAPIKMDQVVLKNALGTNIDIIASRDIPLASN